MLAGATAQAEAVRDLLNDLHESLRRLAMAMHKTTDPVQLSRPCPSEALDEVADEVIAKLWSASPGAANGIWLETSQLVDPELRSGLLRLAYDRLLDERPRTPPPTCPLPRGSQSRSATPPNRCPPKFTSW